jgi:general secretion pathway protein F/type IV pilus assembly protein PilC
MPLFSYKAINYDGEIIRGLVESDNIDIAYDNIPLSGIHILRIRKASRLTNFYFKSVKVWGIKARDIIEFANNLSVMLKAGVPILTALSDISETIENRSFRERITDVKKRIELGTGFSAALSVHHDIFPEIFINLVAVGEETGGLDKSLSNIAVHLQRMEDLKNAIKRSLIYPTFAIIATTGALLFWLIYVLPKITGVFSSMAIELPLITRVLITISNFSRANWYILVLVPVIIFGILKLLAKKESTKYYVDIAKLKMPIVKLVVFNKLLALFAEQSRILIAAGLTIERTFDIIIKVVNNVVFRRALIEIKEDILTGGRINEAIKKHPDLFPNTVVRMIHIGEETGNLTEQLDYLSEHFLKKLDDVSQKMGKMIEPIVIVAIGLIFLLIILGLMSPIYDLISKIGK